MKKYEYVWLDGYEPEPFLRSKVKVTADNTPQNGHSTVHLRNRLILRVRTAF